MAETVLCPHCGKELSSEAIMCPNCGQVLKKAPEKKKGHPVLVILLLIIMCPIGLIVMWATGTFNRVTRIILTIIFIALIAIMVSQDIESANNTYSTDTIEQSEADNVETEVETEEVEAENVSNITFGTEGIISDDGLSLVVNGVTETDSISVGNGMFAYKPDSGKYAVVNVTIKNTSKTSKQLLLNYFKLIDSEDARYVATIIPVADDKFITVDTINPNLDITGNLVFEVPKEAVVSDFVLQYSDYNLFSGVNNFNLK